MLVFWHYGPVGSLAAFVASMCCLVANFVLPARLRHTLHLDILPVPNLQNANLLLLCLAYFLRLLRLTFLGFIVSCCLLCCNETLCWEFLMRLESFFSWL